MTENPCRKCGKVAWSDYIKSVEFFSESGHNVGLDCESEMRLCLACGRMIDVARRFSTLLPEPFKWHAAKIRFRGGHVEEVEAPRLIY